ncbi:MAG: hypothetical protein NWE92_08620 [Candidatus Bathyarchaeota archaeon]|nr:hypothetical protein [Candidatus Bathyarchaeota archaeon]
MNRKLPAFLAMLFFLSVAVMPFCGAGLVFSDNFSSGNFAGWTQTDVGPGASQTVTNGVARFVVPAPASAGICTYSLLRAGGFTSTPNSTIVASADFYFTKVPNGLSQGSTAIFFLYLCDSTDLSGNQGNFGVGIDACAAWAIWIGGNPIYTYAVQSAGAAPVSNTWYHLDLTVDNSKGTVTLAVNGAAVIFAAQAQFTDRVHPITLIVGMGEDWWWQGMGQHEVDVSNVRLDISDAASIPQTVATSPPITAATPKPTVTASASPRPTPTKEPSPSPVQQELNFTLNGNRTNAQITHLTLTADPEARTTTFNFNLSTLKAGTANLTIPKQNLTYTPTYPQIYIDTQQAPNQGYTQDEKNYYVWTQLNAGDHNVSVVFTASASGSPSVPFPVGLLLVAVLVIVGCLAVVVLFRKNRR